jgi:hypothetical protein
MTKEDILVMQSIADSARKREEREANMSLEEIKVLAMKEKRVKEIELLAAMLRENPEMRLRSEQIKARDEEQYSQNFHMNYTEHGVIRRLKGKGR